ncbi:hypothetical protein G3I59_27660 [Amycolatopsis rubida]|uniref:Secreted protein n=1 Tax=Amycolatopsis rubida TaxID=112413 RepID=A0ABX0BYG0_9PSEU|nr:MULTISPECIES: hypothetical protein [Amycolatopsis]MYW94273.1 hypothetical protein [Amycolatopsis rubida]NEC59262.1 hypothetical protein [Amycolatopsis rubida]OAP21355.1 hypothetical protein A4R44_07873 [Amycolatopsis sp. M39]
MKRIAVSLAVSAVAVLGGTGVASAAGHPTSNFGDHISGGAVGGTLTWYNRSVGVSGYVRDDAGSGSTTVTFEFRQAGTLFDVQTRTAANDYKTFGWTEPGPSGGFSRVDIYLGHGTGKILVASVPRKV